MVTEPHRSLEMFFRDEYRPIVRVVAAIVGDRAEAEAIAQDAFVQAIVRWRRIRNYDKPGAWVRRVAIREAVRFARRRNLTSDALPEMIEEHHIAEDIDLRRALTDLPTNQRIAVALFYVEGWSTAEIAYVLDCAPATVRVHLHRGRQALAAPLLALEACDGH